jgi:hypothetical protein
VRSIEFVEPAILSTLSDSVQLCSRKMSLSNQFSVLSGQDGDVHERVGMEIPPGFEILGAAAPTPVTVVTTTVRAVAPVTVEVVIKPEPATAVQRARERRPTIERRFGTRKNREPTAYSGAARGRTATRGELSRLSGWIHA